MILSDARWEAIDPRVEARLGEVLRSWDRTPYHAGWAAKGQGVDCVRFVCAVLDELHGTRTPLSTLPPDASLHDARGSAAALRTIRALFPEHETVRSGPLQPGDVLVTGPSDGGPGHAMIAGPLRNSLWHSTGRGVQRTGLRYAGLTHNRLFRIYRHRNKLEWLTH